MGWKAPLTSGLISSLDYFLQQLVSVVASETKKRRLVVSDAITESTTLTFYGTIIFLNRRVWHDFSIYEL